LYLSNVNRTPWTEVTVDTLLSPPDEIQHLIDRVARRLRARHALRGALFGLWGGVGVGAALVLVSKLIWFGIPAWQLGAAAAALGMCTGFLIGYGRRVLSDTGLALLVDRGLGTREQIVSALEASTVIGDTDAMNLSEQLVERARRLATELEPAEAVPLMRRHEMRPLYFLPLGLALVVGLMFLPPLSSLATPTSDGADPEVVEEGEALEEKIQAIAEEMDAELPEEIREQLDQLAEELQSEELTADEALAELEEMQDELEQFQEDLEQESQADELQQAAEELSQSELTQDLAEALAQPDLAQAAAEAERLAEKMNEASAAEAQAAAGAMQRAAEALAESNPELAQQMQQMAQQMQQAASEQQQGGDSSSMTPEQAQALAEALQQMQQGGMSEQLQQDEELMAMSQRLNGALESST
jgi:hypothetical protein